MNIKANGNVNVNNGGKVNSKKKTVQVESTNGSVVVNSGGSIEAEKNVKVQSGAGKETIVNGTIKSRNGNVYINPGRRRTAGDVKIGKDGSVEAPNGEVYINAETLFISGKIKARTIQKRCKVCILDSTGSIEGRLKTKNKISMGIL